MTAVPEPSYDGLSKNRLSRWQHLQQMRQHFWKSWAHDYLVSLQPRGKKYNRFPNVRPGLVVLLEDKSLPPQQWKLGIITHVYPGEDSLVRVVNVKVGNMMYKRPINKISILSIEDNISTGVARASVLRPGLDVRGSERGLNHVHRFPCQRDARITFYTRLPLFHAKRNMRL